MLKRINITLVAVALLVLQAPLFLIKVSAAADTCTWTGATDGDWNDSANWTGCDNTNLPEDGDTLVFPNGPTNKTLNNDIAGLDLDSISITGSGYSITGSAIELSPTSSSLLSMSGSNNDFGLDTTLTSGDFSKSISSSGASNEISGAITLNLTGGSDMNVGSSGTETLTISGSIGGTTQGFIISNGGTVAYTGSSNFTATGIMQINEDSIATCGSDTCLGIAANDLLLSGGAQFNTTGVRSLPYSIQTSSGTGNPTIEAQEQLTLTGALDINTDTNVTVSSDGFDIFIIPGGIDIESTATLTLVGAGNYLDTEFTIGAITNSGDVAIESGALYLGASLTYDGDFIIRTNGYLDSPTNSELGTTTGGIIVEDGGVLRNGIVGSVTIDDDITIQGVGNPTSLYNEAALYNQGEDLTFTGTITLTGDTTVKNDSLTDAIVFNGSITGAGNLTFLGDAANGGFELNGNTANDYVGNILVESTRLIAEKNNNIIAITGDVVIKGGASEATLLISSFDEVIADDATITLDSSISDAIFEMPNSTTETLGIIKGDGVIDLGLNTPILNVGADNESGVFTGEITSDEGEIEKVGTGTWDVRGTNGSQNSGFSIYRVSAGKLLLNFADTSGSFSPFSVTGGTLGGSDIIGPTTVTGGSIAPGNSPGCLNPDGPLSFNSASTLSIELAGSTICTDYDKIAASGAVSLGNATLSLSPSFTPAANTEFTIVEGSSISGTFSGLADGATVTANGLEFRINYTANSVKLTFLRGVLSQTGSSSFNNTAVIALLISTVSILGIALNKRKSFRYLLNK